jgi:hypothetical protein
VSGARRCCVWQPRELKVNELKRLVAWQTIRC